MKAHFRALAAVAACAALAAPGWSQDKLTPKEAVEIATDAYVYGYSLITTEVTRVQTTNVPAVVSTTACF